MSVTDETAAHGPADGTVAAPAHRSPLLDVPGAVEAEGPDAGVPWHYGDPVREQRCSRRVAAVVDLSHRAVAHRHRPRPALLAALADHAVVTRLRAGRRPRRRSCSPQGPRRARPAPGRRRHDDLDHRGARHGTGAARRGWTRCGSCSGSRSPTSPPTTPCSASRRRRVGAGGAGVLAWRRPVADLVGDSAVCGADVAAHPGHGAASGARSSSRARISLRRWRVRPLAGTWAAEALRVAAWRPRFGFETDHRTIPHEVDWLRTAVHLQKGCYRGQETVARVHNLGRPPRRLVFLHLDGSGARPAGPRCRVVLDGRRQVGFVTTAARHHELGPIALALVKRNDAGRRDADRRRHRGGPRGRRRALIAP